MARETFKRMQAAAHSDYVGALLEDEGRLVLVPVSEDDPWESFRALRRAMRKERRAADATMGLFASPDPLEHSAEIISLESRRRAG